MPIINSQLGGKKPTGTKQITSNGTHDVTDYATADVQVPTTAPAHYIEKTVDANGKLIGSGASFINLTGVTDVGNGGLRGAYSDATFPSNTSIDLSSLTTVSGTNALTNAFYNTTGIESVDLSGLTTVSGGYAFSNAFNLSKLTSVDLSNLTAISGEYAFSNTFYNATSLVSADLSSLTTISGQNSCGSMFNNSTSLINICLSSLTTVSGQKACENMFRYSNMHSIDLSGLTTISGQDALNNMFYNSALESLDLSSLTTISGGGALNGTFGSCGLLQTVKMNKLNIISVQLCASYSQTFGYCYKLESVELGGLTASTFANRQNQFQYLFNSNTGSQAPNGCTVHFPSNFDPSDPDHTFDASTLTGYPTFGGNASYIHVAFDLPATE